MEIELWHMATWELASLSVAHETQYPYRWVQDMIWRVVNALNILQDCSGDQRLGKQTPGTIAPDVISSPEFNIEGIIQKFKWREILLTDGLGVPGRSAEDRARRLKHVPLPRASVLLVRSVQLLLDQGELRANHHCSISCQVSVTNNSH